MRLGFGLAMLWVCVVLMARPATAGGVVNKTLLGVAVKGTDVVSYFTDGRVEKGQDAFSFQWQGATWRFASQAHRDLFAASPGTYAPQYGGYCAWAMSQNRKAPIDPDAWRVVNGKLYLNYSPDIQAKWEQDIPGLIAKADAFWQRMSVAK
ncbi:MAG: YHS domain protein [Lentisphaerae bacterium]|nr:YHS domain protein [Lentisphaerota bacterium]